MNYNLRLADLAAGKVETLLPVTVQAGRRHVVWSPDGSAIAYHEWVAAPVFTSRARVLRVDSRVDGFADSSGEFFWDGLPTWSNDGERLAIFRGYADGYADVTVAIVTADGTRLLAESPHDLELFDECCPVFEWAPDDSAILVARTDQQGLLVDHALIDPLTGDVTKAPWTATSDPAWQRLAR